MGVGCLDDRRGARPSSRNSRRKYDVGVYRANRGCGRIRGAADDTIDKQIRHALEPLGLSEVRIETTASDDESWRDGWRAFFRGQQLSDKLWVGPPWETPASEGVSIVIEPGQAFGTGTHETTRGCLKVLEQVLSGRASQLIWM